jgi:hypothetical protein
MRGRHGRTATLAVAAFLAASGVAAVASEPGRDEARFLSHVKEYFGDGPRPGWSRPVTDDVFVTEGDHACAWLAQQPVVTGRAPSQTSYELFSRFITQVEPTPGWHYGTGRGLRGSVTYDAWTYLCPGIRQSRTWNPPIEDWD